MDAVRAEQEEGMCDPGVAVLEAWEEYLPVKKHRATYYKVSPSKPMRRGLRQLSGCKSQVGSARVPPGVSRQDGKHIAESMAWKLSNGSLDEGDCAEALSREFYSKLQG